MIKEIECKCDKCDAIFKYEKSDDHLKQAHSAFFCVDECRFMFEDKEQLRQHMTIDCVQSVMECIVCEYREVRSQIETHDCIRNLLEKL